MKVKQYVMAYGGEQDRVRAILPDGFTSLRPVLRINAEIRDDRVGYVEFNVPVRRGTMRTASAAERHSQPIRQM